MAICENLKPPSSSRAIIVSRAMAAAHGDITETAYFVLLVTALLRRPKMAREIRVFDSEPAIPATFLKRWRKDTMNVNQARKTLLLAKGAMKNCQR